MAAFQLALPDSLKINQTALLHCQDIINLVHQFRPKDKTRNQLTVELVIKQVMSGLSALEWEENLLRNFLMMSYGLSRDDLQQHIKLQKTQEENIVLLLRDRANWLAGLGLYYPKLDADTRIQGIGLWLSTMLNTGEILTDADQLIHDIIDECGPFSLPTESLSSQLKLQLVLFLVNRLQFSPEPAFSMDLAKEWCIELSTNPKTQKMVDWAARHLNVDLPNKNKINQTNKDKADGIKEEFHRSSQLDRESLRLPDTWPTPELFTEEQVRDEFNRLLPVLINQTEVSERTKSQLNRLGNDANFQIASRYIQYAFSDLWRAYWTLGDRSVLDAACELARLLLSINSFEQLDNRKGQVLHLWMNTQLPNLIYTCDVDDLVRDAPYLVRYMNSAENQAILFSGIIQAHAGEYRYLSSRNDIARRDALIRDNRSALEKIHKNYRNLVGNNDRDEENPAWESLSLAQKTTESHVVFGNAGSQGVGSSWQPIQTILDDQALKDVIRLGSPEQTKAYTANHLSRILELIRRRLDIRIGPEFVMLPEGSVYQPGAAKARQDHPDFLSGKLHLERGNYDDAQRIFERLVGKVTGTGADIARNFQAYALAKLGDPLSALVELKRLFDNNSSFPSVYWNYACCLPSEEMDKKLDTFYAGLERAPHPKFLDSVVYLASLKQEGEEDDRLRSWLPAMINAEALLWLYNIEYDHLDFDGRLPMLLRLGQYVRKGEPIIPNPLDREIPGDRLANVIPTLLERNQSKAIEFWLKCRERIARDRFDYWELRTDYLEQIGKKKEAIESFIEEIRRRLTFLANRIKNSSHYNRSIVDSTSRRIDHWLRLSMTDELRSLGQQIFENVSQFERDINNRVLLMPRDRRIREYYHEPPRTPPPPPPSVPTPISTPTSTQTPVSISPQAPINPVENLDIMLAQIGGTCKARLHDVKHLPHVINDLNRLIQALKTNGGSNSANSLESLIDEWNLDRSHMRKEDRQESLDRAKGFYSDFRSNLQRELSPNTQGIALPLLDALNRVNDHLARTSSLLPRIIANTIDEKPAIVDFSAEKTAFIIRVTCQPGDPQVRIKKAEATLETGTFTFSVRDRLEDLPIYLSPENNIILTFEILPDGKDAVEESRRVRIDITYEYAGSNYIAQPCYIELQAFDFPEFPNYSPYIYGRPLQASEIERLFVGREKEQQDILMSVTNGQQVVRYVEGIRRVGKSSLLRSIEYKIQKLGLPLIPVQVAPDSVSDPGLVLYNLLKQVAQHPDVLSAGVEPPNEDRCKDNPTAVYDDFQNELGLKIPDRRVVALLDDFQELVITAGAVREKDPSLANGFRSVLNKIRQKANPDARLLWVFAGQVVREQYRKMLPNVLFWGDMISLPIAFLDRQAIGEILRKPLLTTPLIVPDETVTHLHFLTAGHPECVQQLADYMFGKAIAEKRLVLTPADAEEAAYDLADTQDTYADSWYPLSELSKVQNEFMASFIHAVSVGGRIEAYRLAPDGHLTDAQKTGVDDLLARKILDTDDDGKIFVKSIVLDLWLRRRLPRLISETDTFNGSVAVFVDVANLTNGTGSNIITGLQTDKGEGVEGRYSLKSILLLIEKYAKALSPAPVAAHYAVNYPKNSPAVIECNAQGYYIENVPAELWIKGSDDHVLSNKASDVEQGYPMVNHYVIVTGDKDYRIKIEHLLKNGKYVHVLSRAGSLSRKDTKESYDYLAGEFPHRFTVERIETLIEKFM